MFDGFENVSGLRTLEDARTLRAALTPEARLLIIGAGFIGQEVASAARRADPSTTIVEAATAPLAGSLGAELGAWLTALHRAARRRAAPRAAGSGGSWRGPRSIGDAHGRAHRSVRPCAAGRGRRARPGVAWRRPIRARRGTHRRRRSNRAEPASTRPATQPPASIRCWKSTSRAATGRAPDARAAGPPRRCSTSTPGPPPSQASGATSTASACSTSAMLRSRTSWL